MKKNYKYQKQGEYLSQVRQKAALSQTDLAQKIGVSKRAITRWEKGVSFPDDDILLHLTEELNIPLLSLLSGQDILSSDKEKLAKELFKERSQENRNRNIAKNAALFLLIFLDVVFLIMGIISFQQSDGFKSGLEHVWNIELPSSLTKEFAISDQSFTGDGEVYSVYTDNGGGKFYLNFKEGPSEEAESLMYSFLHDLSIPPEYLPDFSHPYLWQIIQKNDGRDQMVCFFDLETEQYYFIEQYT